MSKNPAFLAHSLVLNWFAAIVDDRVYEKAGFRRMKEEPHHSFGHDLIGQEWELELTNTFNQPANAGVSAPVRGKG